MFDCHLDNTHTQWKCVCTHSSFFNVIQHVIVKVPRLNLKRALTIMDVRTSHRTHTPYQSYKHRILSSQYKFSWAFQSRLISTQNGKNGRKETRTSRRTHMEMMSVNWGEFCTFMTALIIRRAELTS